MTHQEKIERMYRHMDALGVGRSTAAPPAWRLLWKMGIEVPPPMFVGFLSGALAMGAGFGLAWGLVMWLGFWIREGRSLGEVAVLSLLAGTLFGLAMAAIYRHMARKHGLPSWADYRGAD